MERMSIKKLLTFFLLFTFACSPNWNYKHPEKWGEVDERYKFCKIGYNQSPIDVVGQFSESDLSFNYEVSEVGYEKTDYVKKVNFYTKSFVSRGKKKYILRNLSFHHPSEHLVDGKPYSLEMQIAHKSEDEQWLILAVFLEVGKENKNFADLVNFLTSGEKDGKIAVKNLIKSDDEVFFYDGSFTTPPCKEGVKWYVMKRKVEISKEQMNAIIKSAILTKTNARPVQEFHPEKY
jgi:carbonic anhydrase